MAVDNLIISRVWEEEGRRREGVIERQQIVRVDWLCEQWRLDERGVALGIHWFSIWKWASDLKIINERELWVERWFFFWGGRGKRGWGCQGVS